MVAQIPDVIWEAMTADAEEQGTSITHVLTDILRRHYKIDRAMMPKPKKAGRKPKPRG